MNYIVLIGGKGLSEQLLSWMRSDNIKFKLVDIYDDYIKNKDLKKIKLISKNRKLSFYLSIADPQLRKRIYLYLKKNNKELKFNNFIHSSSIINDKKNIIKNNEGTLVGPNCLVEQDVKIGKCNILNSYVSLFHKSEVGNFCTLAPYSCCLGESKIGDCVLFGAYSSINPRKKINKNVILGSHTNVVKNISAPGIYIGNPAHKLKNLFE